MAKGKVSTCSRESAMSNRDIIQISQTERLKVMAQKVSIILTPCDLITDIDCGKFTSESKESFDNERCQSPEKGLNCCDTKHNDLTSPKSADQEHNGTANGLEENTVNESLRSPSSGFTPVSFYGSKNQNVTPKTKLFSPNACKTLWKESGDSQSNNSSGLKRKFKKQSISTAAKKKRRTSSGSRQNKSTDRKSVNVNAVKVCGRKSVDIDDKDVQNKSKTEPYEFAMNTAEGDKESAEDGSQLPQLNYDSEGSGIASVCDKSKSNPSVAKSILSEIESTCSEASLCSGPGTVVDGFCLRKNGNEYFFSNSVDGNISPEQLTPSSESPGEEGGMGTTCGTINSHPSCTEQHTSLMWKMPDCNENTNDSQSSFSLSMPSPVTSESDDTLKLSSKEAESSSSKSSPEHQASIMRYFKTLPGPRCKTKIIANGIPSSSTLSSAETSPEGKNRITPKKKKSGKKQEQMYLDLGQKDFGHVTCPTCGMVYTRAQPEDEAAHIRHHKSFVSGLKFTGWKNECVVKEYHDGRVIMVSPDDPRLHLKKVEEVRKVVDSELGFVADVPHRRSGAKTFLFITTKKVVGCAVAVQVDQGYPVLPSPGESSTPEKQIAAWCCSTTPQSAQCGISRIWVHSQYRRKKVATRLLDCVRTNFIYGCIIPRELVAFSDPTPDGKRLANNYAGTSQFLVFR